MICVYGSIIFVLYMPEELNLVFYRGPWIKNNINIFVDFLLFVSPVNKYKLGKYVNLSLSYDN